MGEKPNEIHPSYLIHSEYSTSKQKVMGIRANLIGELD